MNILPALPPCPARPRKGHKLAFFIPESSQDDITAICEQCGMGLRVPASGPLQGGSLDDLSAEEIERRMYGRKR